MLRKEVLVRSLKAACLMEILTGVTATHVFLTNDDDDGDDRCDGTWVSDSTDMMIVSSMQVSVTAVTCPQLYFDRT